MNVEDEATFEFETSFTMKLGSYGFPINTVASLTHANEPLTVIAFGGLSSEIQILIRCMDQVRQASLMHARFIYFPPLCPALHLDCTKACLYVNFKKQQPKWYLS